MSKTDITRELLTKTDALQTGHFRLSSGLHSDQYCQCARLFEHPADAEKLAVIMAEQLKERASEFGEIDLVLAPALGAILWGYELARAVGVRSLFAERQTGKKFELRRGFHLPKGARILLAEDVVTTGGSVMELVPLVEALGAEVAGFASVIDRSKGKFQPDKPFAALLPIEAVTWSEEDCPLCAEGNPIVKPGSRKMD